MYVRMDSMVGFVRETVVLGVEINIVINLMGIVSVKMDIMGIDVKINVLATVNHVIK